MKYLLLVILAVLFPLVSAAQETNLTDGCVENYDPNQDYFPDKVEVEYAAGFEVEYFNNYRVLRVLSPWAGAAEPFEYVLVQCGTPAPEGYDDAQIIETPIDTLVSLSTTYLPHLIELGELDSLLGVDSDSYIFTTTPEVIELINQEKLANVGLGANINLEIMLDLNPDLVIAYALGLPEYDAHPLLLDSGIHVALNAEYLENTPLGQAEWIKFTALFFNKEALGNEYFNTLVAKYETLTALTEAVESRPTVFAGVPFDGSWYVPGGQSYVAQLFDDAGADYLWKDEESAGGVQMDFEVVLEKAQNADFWLNVGFWSSLDDGLAEDERYAEFSAFQNGQVYNNNARQSESGGSDYYESAVIHPDVLLADLIHIFHPDLLPDHTLYYYQKLE
jgi:iron complex transport system substrate-binding protein